MDLVMINKFKYNMWMHDNESRAYNPSFLFFKYINAQLICTSDYLFASYTAEQSTNHTYKINKLLRV